MRQLHFTFGIAVTLLALGAVTSSAYAASCKNVTWEITNTHNREDSIRLLKVKYYVGDKWKTEDIKNIDCKFNTTCQTLGDNLAGQLDEHLDKFRFVYKYKESKGWSKEVEGGDKYPEKTKCIEDRTYMSASGEPFLIFGKSDTNE